MANWDKATTEIEDSNSGGPCIASRPPCSCELDKTCTAMEIFLKGDGYMAMIGHEILMDGMCVQVPAAGKTSTCDAMKDSDHR